MSSFSGQHIVILGLGASGLAAAELAILLGATVTALDTESTPRLQERAEHLSHRGARVMLDWSGETWSEVTDLVVISPGIASESALGQFASQVSCPVLSELEFGYLSTSCPILAITGTNGKTTTTELTVHCLKGLGYRVMAAGNIGLPLCEAARRSAGLDFLVVEVSSFQLERIDRFAPVAGALLNCTDDHLDRYPDALAYLETKLRLFRHVPHASRTIVNHALLDAPPVAALLADRGATPTTFSAEPEHRAATWFLDERRTLCVRRADRVEDVLKQSDIRLLGRHNVENVAAALALCESVGASAAELAPLVQRFAPSAHRLELVATRNRVTYINDSKATNPDAMIQAIRTVAEERSASGRIRLIAGGRDKAMDFSSVTPWIRDHVCAIYLMGETRKTLGELWSPVVPCQHFTSLRALVDAAMDAVEPGDVVLLSPGCASQDMFRDYAERGNLFAQEVRRRLGE